MRIRVRSSLVDMVGGGVLCEGFLDFGLTKVGSDEERGVRRDIKSVGKKKDKHKIYTGSATTRAYIQSPSNQWFWRFLSTL